MTYKNFKQYDLLAILFYIICHTIIFSTYAILKHNAFHTNTFDFGIFNQIFWSMVHNGTQINTLETSQISLHLLHYEHHIYSVFFPSPKPAVPINHLGVHFSLILYLFAPIYAIFQSPKTLLILQAFMLALGALPLYLIARKKTKSILFAQAISITYLLYPALFIMSVYDFHEFSFAPVLILFTLYFLETGKYKSFWIFFVLTLFIKEDLALSGLFIGLYIILVKKEKKLGTLVFLISLIYFIATIKIFMPFFGQPYNFTDRYLEFASTKYKGYTGVTYDMITNPIHTLKVIFFNPQKLSYIIKIFYPVIFLPFCSSMAFILILPSLLINLLSSSIPQFSIYSHYNGVIIPFLFFTTIIGYNKLPEKLKKYQDIFPQMMLVIAAVTLLSTTSRLFLSHDLFLPLNSPENITLENLLKKIPPQASVASMENIVPHLAQRKEVWLFPAVNDAEYVLFNISETTNYAPIGYNKIFEILQSLLLQKKYGVLDFTGTYILLKKDFTTEKNDQTLVEVTKRYQLIKKEKSLEPPAWKKSFYN